MIPIKICGITNTEDALASVNYGASALGFIFAPSKRQVEPETVRGIIRRLPLFVTTVGVFVNEDPAIIHEIMRDCHLNLAQLHGDESPDMANTLEGRAIKAFKADGRPPDPIWKETNIYAALVDTYTPDQAGGTGETFDWQLFQEFRILHKPLILAGGLHAGNVGMAIEITSPDGLDVSSGVEQKPGRKDHAKIAAFIHSVHLAKQTKR